jgi:hypothetical protein
MRAQTWVRLGGEAIDQVWIQAATECGFRVIRSDAAYASTDGRGTIIIGEPHTLDDDDSVAQLVLHEICHALVQGEERWNAPDWGLDNTSDRDGVREEACLRLQAYFADRQQLRTEMTPTTEWKSYYRALPAMPLERTSHSDNEACALAIAGEALAREKGISRALERALAATVALGRAPAVAAARLHPLGLAFGPAAETCGTCSWRYHGGRGVAVDRCRQSVGDVGDGVRVSAAMPACEKWEAPVDCFTCGACCREAYHTVSVSVRDPVVWKQPGLVVRDGHRWSLMRAQERCAALEVVEESPNEKPGRRYSCSIYEDRPRTCREFERGGRHCLSARRRVGLSR